VTLSPFSPWHSAKSIRSTVNEPMSTHDIHETRSILQALAALADGSDVVIIAHPAAVAFAIADEVAHYSLEMQIPHELRDDNRMERSDDEVPLITIRPFGWEALPMRRLAPAPKVFVIDRSARHDRTLTPATRFVMPLEIER